jgi:hypothetical protein
MSPSGRNQRMTVGAWRSINGLALGFGGDFAVVADTDTGLLAPDKWPPWTSRDGTQPGVFFGAGLCSGGVGQELVEQDGWLHRVRGCGRRPAQWEQAFSRVVSFCKLHDTESITP